jgi:hypothetical protein
MNVIMPLSQSTMDRPEEKYHDLSCPLFFTIPAEIRLKIYDEIYEDVVVRTPPPK